MSGGHFEYENGRISDWIEIIQQDITQKDIPKEWVREYTPAQVSAMKELKLLVKYFGDLLHSYDYAMSGDTCLDGFVKDLRVFKKNIKELYEGGKR